MWRAGMKMEMNLKNVVDMELNGRRCHDGKRLSP